MNDASFYKWRENMGHGRVYGVFDEGHENENRRVEKMFAQLSMQNDLLTSPLPVALRALSARLTLSSTIKTCSTWSVTTATMWPKHRKTSRDLSADLLQFFTGGFRQFSLDRLEVRRR
jgi:hypothetical protein